MDKRYIKITILFIFLFAINAFAETTIKAEVDKLDITTDDLITYKLVVISSEKRLAAPQISKFEGFSIISQAQTSEISISKGSPKTLLVYVFILQPKDTGKFTIEPSTIKIKNETYPTDAFNIEVRQGESIPEKPQQEEPSLPEEPLPKSGQITL